MWINIDGMSQINKIHGYDTGDKVITLIKLIISAAIKSLELKDVGCYRADKRNEYYLIIEHRQSELISYKTMLYLINFDWNLLKENLFVSISMEVFHFSSVSTTLKKARFCLNKAKSNG